MNFKDINQRINNEICYNTIDLLKDENLHIEYIKCKSVKNEIMKLKNILEKYTNIINSDNIIKDYTKHLIPSGTKGVIRGNKFNEIVKNKIISLNLDNLKYLIEFEKNIDICEERPDWYIKNLISGKIIIGMNQIDLFSGGHQINRAYKYLFNNKLNNENIKLLCVICKFTEIKTYNKTYKIFDKGFEENTICYLNNLENIIINFLK